MKRSAGRLLIILATIVGLLGSIPIQQAQAQPQGGEGNPTPGASAPADEQETIRRYLDAHPEAILPPSYSWTPGNTFQPRASLVQHEYLGGSCMYRANTSGNPDADAFTAALQLPQGATILGLRLYAYDTSTTGDSRLLITSYTGAGGFDNIAISATTGSAGYVSSFVSLSTPYVVNNDGASLALAWYSDATGNTLALCGAQVLYIAPYPYLPSTANTPTSVIDAAASFAGSTFRPRDSSIDYTYSGVGCVTSSAGGAFTIDVDLPGGSVINTVKLYFYDTSSANGLTIFLTTYNGVGGFSDRLVFTNGSAASGFGTQVGALSTPLVVSQASFSLVLTASLPGDTNVRLCSVQIGYAQPIDTVATAPDHRQVSTPEEQATLPQTTTTLYRWIAGSTFTPRYASTTYTYKGAGCVSITGGTPILNTYLHLPNGAQLLGARFYYYDANASDSMVFVTDYNGAGSFNEFIVENSAGNAGYSSIFATPASSYLVNNSMRGLGLVWNSGGVVDTTMALCGIRVMYNVDVQSHVFLPLTQR